MLKSRREKVSLPSLVRRKALPGAQILPVVPIPFLCGTDALQPLPITDHSLQRGSGTSWELTL